MRWLLRLGAVVLSLVVLSPLAAQAGTRDPDKDRACKVQFGPLGYATRTDPHDANSWQCKTHPSLVPEPPEPDLSPAPNPEAPRPAPAPGAERLAPNFTPSLSQTLNEHVVFRSLTVPQFARAYSGEHWVSQRPLKLYAAPSAGSHVVFDLPRGFLLYAEQSDAAGWLKVNGLELGPWPKDTESNVDPGQKEDGSLIPPLLYNGNSAVPLKGYVGVSDVAKLDFSPDKGFDGVSVPSFWGDFGVKEDRSWPENVSASPIDAIVIVEVHFGDKYIAQCTGFFLDNLTTIITAGHCFTVPDGSATSKIVVQTYPGSSQQEDLSGAVVAREFDPDGVVGRKGDWAIVRLDRPPSRPGIEPLRLHDGSAFGGRAALTIFTIGFPADLDRASIQRFGVVKPAVTHCVLFPTRIQRRWSDRGANMWVSRCATWDGNSGGPELVWNGRTQRYEVIGIVEGTEGDQLGIFAELKPSVMDKLVDRKAELVKTYGSDPLDDALFRDQLIGRGAQNPAFRDVPGIGRLIEYLAYSDTEGHHFELTSSFMRALDANSPNQPRHQVFPNIGELNAIDSGEGQHVNDKGIADRNMLLAYRAALVTCQKICTAAALDSNRQLSLGLGDQFDHAPQRTHDLGGVYISKAEISGDLERWPGESIAFIGGDMYILSKEGSVSLVARDIGSDLQYASQSGDLAVGFWRFH